MPLLPLLPLPEAPGPLLCICKAPPSFKISFKVTSLKAPRRPSIKSKLLPRTPTALHLELMDKLNAFFWVILPLLPGNGRRNCAGILPTGHLKPVLLLGRG